MDQNNDLPKQSQQPPIKLDDLIGDYTGIRGALEGLKLKPADKALVGILLTAIPGLAILSISHTPWYASLIFGLLAALGMVLTWCRRDNGRKEINISIEPRANRSRQREAGQSPTGD